ncbi:MAG TPA: FkbM family methyltransferase [Candidatus Aquilonibacter sp.]|nr:FkbM family methyltransferase [Candidatus Aquilonibacter sp.]
MFAVEAEPRNCTILRKNIAVNGFKDRVTVIPKAALETRRKVTLHRNLEYFGGHAVFEDTESDAPSDCIEIEAVPLDDMLPAKVDFVKIDTEGSEPYILRGMRRVLRENPQIKIVMEINPPALERGGVSTTDFFSRGPRVRFSCGDG